MKEVVIFGQIKYEEEYSRSYQMVNAIKALGYRATYCVSNLNVNYTNNKSSVKILVQLLCLPFRWIKLLSQACAMPNNVAMFVPYPAYVDAPLALMIAKIKGNKVVLDWFFGLYETLVIDRKIINESGLLAKLLKRYEGMLLMKSDLVLFDTAAHCEDSQSLFSNKLNLDWLPVGINEAIWHKVNFKKQESKFTVMFWGTFIPLHGIDVIVRAAALLNDNQIEIVMIGTGQLAPEIDKLISSMGLMNLNRVPHFLGMEELKRKVTNADVVLGVFSNNKKTDCVVPYKVHQALASAKPLITCRSMAISEILVHRESAYLVPAADPQALSQAIIELKSDTRLLERISAGGREVYDTHLSNRQIQKRMRCIINSLLPYSD